MAQKSLLSGVPICSSSLVYQMSKQDVNNQSGDDDSREKMTIQDAGEIQAALEVC